MLHLERIAELDVSAASGLVAGVDALYVVADDEISLAVYAHDGAPRRHVALFEGQLPQEHAARKREKPDLEALAQLPDGRLLALGSGSTERRLRGALIDPARDFSVRAIALDALYEALARELPELNIEGAVVHGGTLWLAQRGNGERGDNACIALELAGVLDALDRRSALDAGVLAAIHPVQLGSLAGTPLSFTDLASHPTHGLLFSAAAEASASTYEDGACAGSVLGVLSPELRVLRTEPLTPSCKIEGLSTVIGGTGLLLVADPDDRSQRAPLFRATLK